MTNSELRHEQKVRKLLKVELHQSPFPETVSITTTRGTYSVRRWVWQCGIVSAGSVAYCGINSAGSVAYCGINSAGSVALIVLVVWRIVALILAVWRVVALIVLAVWHI